MEISQFLEDENHFHYTANGRRSWSSDEMIWCIKEYSRKLSGGNIDIHISQNAEKRNWLNVKEGINEYVVEVRCCSYTQDSKYPFYSCSQRSYNSLRNYTSLKSDTSLENYNSINNKGKVKYICLLFKDENSSYWCINAITSMWKKQTNSTRYRVTFDGKWKKYKVSTWIELGKIK